jgi:hypothetical protein
MTHDRDHSDELGAAIRAAVAEVHAPAALRARIEAERAGRRRRTSRGFGSLHLAGAAAALACAAVLVLGLGLLGGDNRTERPTLQQAALVTLTSSNGPPPAEDKRHPVLVRAGINGLRFPYWDDEFGLEATSVKRGHIAARSAMTVAYEGKGQRIGYTIVAGPALKLPSDARTVRRGSLQLAVFRAHGAQIVTWRRAGHTCVLASRDAGAARLVRLAAWTGGGKIPGYGG